MRRIPPPKPGVYYDVDNETYRAWEAASCSTLKTILHRSAKHARYQELTPKEPTPALREGTAIHTMILEPMRFSDQFAIAQQCATNKKSGERCSNAAVCRAGGEWVCGVHAKGKETEQSEQQLVAQVDYDRWRDIHDAVCQHPTAGRLVASVEQVETSLCWIDQATGTCCKARIDGIAPGLGTLVDIKTTEDAGADFARSVHKYGYYRQAAWYLAAAAACDIEAEAFAFIVVEKQPPHDVCVYQCPGDLLALGWEELRPAVETYQQCVTADHWPGHADQPVWLTLPEWRQRQLEREKYSTVNL